MIFQEHPIQIIAAVGRAARAAGLVTHFDDLAFEFSFYNYTPLAIEDERKLFKIAAAQVPTWFSDAAKSLASQQDIAFHSRVYVKAGSKVLHIPMVDFKNFDPERDRAALTNALDHFGINDFVLFRSGRSFHLYGTQLLTETRWLAFLGRILLLNLPGQPEIVDVRWVGHRLMGGYGTLRWTKNNPHYAAMPTRYDFKPA